MLDDDAVQADLIAVLNRSRFNPDVSSASLAAQVIDVCRIHASYPMHEVDLPLPNIITPGICQTLMVKNARPRRGAGKSTFGALVAEVMGNVADAADLDADLTASLPEIVA